MLVVYGGGRRDFVEVLILIDENRQQYIVGTMADTGEQVLINLDTGLVYKEFVIKK